MTPTLYSEQARHASEAPPAADLPFVHIAFATLARAQPGLPALRNGLQVLSYGALAERVRSLSQALRASGVGPGSVVGIGLRRSCDQIALLLAVFQLGAAFVPLDPALPVPRRAAMAADCGASLVVSESSAGLDGVAHVDLACLLAGAGTLHFTAQEPGPQPPASGLAYVLYTSGSTGRPKGVHVGHAALACRLDGMQQRLPLHVDDRFLQRTGLAFDVAIEEIFWPLTVGASVVLADTPHEMDAAYLVALMARQGVSIADFVPALLARVLDLPQVTECRQLRRVLCGGEAMSPALMRQFLGTLPGVDLVNVYGPTEAVINALLWQVPASAAAGGDGEALPIGRPLPHTRAEVLDHALQPVSPGEIGELCLGGVLAFGYAGQPALTQTHFIVDPRQPHERLYRSGDLVRMRPDGELAFHGRMDHQIKLRGARIEPGEIEVALLGHRQVREACVLVQGSGPQARLIAYLVTKGETQTTATWRNWLARSLPRYMLPSAVVTLAEFPRTATGKLDRRALPLPPECEGQGESEGDVVTTPDGSAGTTLNTHVLRLFQRILHRPHVAADADFFEAGGDSLQATELLVELNDLMGMDLDLEALYTHPSVATLARHIEADTRAASRFNLAREFAREDRAVGMQRTPNLVRLAKGDGAGATAPVLFCVHPGDGGSSMYLPMLRLMRTRPAVHAFVAWDLQRRLWPRHSVQEIAADYLVQLRLAQPHGPVHLIAWSSGAGIAYEMAQQLAAQGRDVGWLGMVDPFEAWETEGDADLPMPAVDATFSNEDWRIVLMIFVLDDCLRPPDHPFWQWPETQRFQWVCDTARGLGRFPHSMTADTFAYLCRVVRAHVAAYDRYRPTRSGLDMTMFLPRRPADINLSYWPALTSGRCEVIEVGGDHLSMMRVPHVAAVAEAVDRVFERLDAAHLAT